MVEHEIAVGLVMDCIAPSNPWGTHHWIPVQILKGAPETPPWTVLSRGTDRIRYFAGTFTIRLYSTESAFYRDNLIAERPRLWVAMQPEGSEPPISILAVTANPTEGEGYTQTGTNVVEVIDIPPDVAAEVAAFVEANHVDQVFEKRKRDKRPSAFLERRGPHSGSRS